MEIKIFVASQVQAPIELGAIYKKIFVGANTSESEYVNKLDHRDDDGENISGKNKNYCELTAVYWAWKNTKTDIIGLSHYRRYFLFQSKNYFGTDRLPFNSNDNDYIESINNLGDKDRLFVESNGWIVPPQKKLVKSIVNDYKEDEACIAQDWEVLKKALFESFPEIIEEFEKYSNQNKIRHFNMFVTSFEEFDAYCHWLFKILQNVDGKLDYSGRSSTQARVLGFMAERLLGFYLSVNKKNVKEVMVGYFRPDHRIFKIYRGENKLIRQMVYGVLKILLDFKIIITRLRF